MSGHAYTAEGVRAPGAPRARGELPRAAAALGFAALCALAMVVVYLVFAHVPAAKTRDATTLHDFMRLNTSFISINGPRLLKLLSPALFTLWGIAIVCFALARGRPRAAFAAALLMAVAPLTAEVLKPLLAHPHVQIGHFHVGAAS